MPAKGGVVVATVADELYWAGEFSGDLAPFTGDQPKLLALAVTNDRILACDDEERMWSAELASAHQLHREDRECRELEARGDVVVVIDRAGRVLRSKDQGRRFTPVDTGRFRARRLYWDDDLLHVVGESSDGRGLVLRPDGTVTNEDDDELHELRDRGQAGNRPESELRRAEESARKQVARLHAALYDDHDASGVCVANKEESWCVDGLKTASVPDATCGVIRTSQRTHVTVCNHTSKARTGVYEFEAGKWRQLVAWPTARRTSRTWLPVAGNHKDVVVLGPCTPGYVAPRKGNHVGATKADAKADTKADTKMDDRKDAKADPVADARAAAARAKQAQLHASLCWFDGSELRTVPVATRSPRFDRLGRASSRSGGPATIPTALHDNWLLLGSNPNEAFANVLGAAEEYRLVDLTGEHAPVAMDYDALGNLERPPRFVGDELIAMLVTTNGTILVATRPGDDNEIRRLPKGAFIFAFADADHGIAGGSTADQLWTTADQGRSWQPVSVPVKGDPKAVRVAWARCSNVACGALPFVLFDPLLREHLPADSFRVVAPLSRKR